MTTGDVPTVGALLAALADDTDTGLLGGESLVPWRDHVATSMARADMLAELLAADRPPHVGVLLGNGPEFSYLLGASALSSLVVVGLNDTRRGAALSADVVRADCQAVIVEDATVELLDESSLPADVRVLNVDAPGWRALVNESRRPNAMSAAERAARIVPDELLMLIFTSGTSGTPKAVRCTQGNVGIAGSMLAARFGIGHSDVVAVSMPMFHSNAVMAGWTVAVAGGASLVLRKFSARGFVDDVHRYGVTYSNYVGKPLNYILATPARPADAAGTLRVMYGNEASAEDRRRFAERFGCQVVDGYGSTELGIAITRTPDTPPDALGPLVDPVAVVDVATGEPVGPGEVGELVNTSGAGMFGGYYNDPESTSERMRDGVYHSGDLGWVDDAGFVHFAGRLGDWLRVDGENLGAGPIEQILVRHPAIREAAVFGVPVAIGDEVHAALVCDDGHGASRLDAEGFAEFLAAQSDLGPKQWPCAVHLVDRMPETATFKTVRRRLRTEAPAPTWTWDGERYVTSDG
ncbi:long-chain-fatty-acid--CoA ligase FadD17 [Gordonia sinesedis]